MGSILECGIWFQAKLKTHLSLISLSYIAKKEKLRLVCFVWMRELNLSIYYFKPEFTSLNRILDSHVINDYNNKLQQHLHIEGAFLLLPSQSQTNGISAWNRVLEPLVHLGSYCTFPRFFTAPCIAHWSAFKKWSHESYHSSNPRAQFYLCGSPSSAI